MKKNYAPKLQNIKKFLTYKKKQNATDDKNK